eukprot:7170742-Lingulodinium_polyedra.AAC.1
MRAWSAGGRWRDGGACNRVFYTRQALLSHARKVHGARMLSALATYCNECVRCNTVFSTRVLAYHHLEGSFARGYCLRERARTIRE